MGWVILSDKFSNSVAAVVRDKPECVDFNAAFDVVRNDVPDNAFISFICFRELVLVEDIVLVGSSVLVVEGWYCRRVGIGGVKGFGPHGRR